MWIVGILDQNHVADDNVGALRRLEYWGYDGAGIAILNMGEFVCRRAVGKIARLQSLLLGEPAESFAGIGHTRWAAHGAPSLNNTHPRTKQDACRWFIPAQVSETLALGRRLRRLPEKLPQRAMSCFWGAE